MTNSSLHIFMNNLKILKRFLKAKLFVISSRIGVGTTKMPNSDLRTTVIKLKYILNVESKFVKTIFLFIAISLNQLVFAQGKEHPGKKIIPTIFWTWQDSVIDNPNLLLEQLKDIKAHGFEGVYAMPRATHYQLFDNEMINAVKVASDACINEGMEFNWGADPRMAAHETVKQTGYGAEMIIVNKKFNPNIIVDGPQPDRLLLNECKVENNRYSLKYEYPSRRDIHLLSEVSLWLNPLSVEKVYAYQRENGNVVRSSIRDITADAHFFLNRSFYYVEVFGKTNLPKGDWYVFAFPKFMTNMYAFDSPEHEKIMSGLLDEYKKRDIHFNGFWWDEPGYYFQFGQFAISDRIYNDFKNKYGYDLKENLYSLILDLDDNSQLKVRKDYFELLMDYVFGSEQRFWKYGEKLFGPLRMGIHQTWHTIPDDMYAGCGDYWRGLVAVDGGYSDDGAFENYFKTDLAGKYEQTAFMILASSLAKFSQDGVAHYNRWGVNYTNEVPVYWNDLMPLFSNTWLQHCYGYTGVLGASRGFGPGFPDHSSWSILPELNKRTEQVVNITKYKLPVAEVAIVFPISTFLTSLQPTTGKMMDEIRRLVGIMPALGIQVDAISDWLFAEGKIKDGVFQVRDQKYKAVLLPCSKIVSKETLAAIRELQKKNFPIYFIDELPQLTVDGEKVDLKAKVSFSIGDDMDKLSAEIKKLDLPSPVTQLKDAYVTVVPGSGKDVYVLVMPVEPGKEVSGQITCNGKKVVVEKSSKLSIYHVDSRGSRKVFE